MDTMRICEFCGYDTKYPCKDRDNAMLCSPVIVNARDAIKKKKLQEASPLPQRAEEDAYARQAATTPEDVVVKPSHYARWSIEPVTYTMRNGFEFWRGNIVKYASRAGYKLYPNQDATESEITDLKKVIRYAEMRINQLKGEVEL